MPQLFSLCAYARACNHWLIKSQYTIKGALVRIGCSLIFLIFLCGPVSAQSTACEINPTLPLCFSSSGSKSLSESNFHSDFPNKIKDLLLASARYTSSSDAESIESSYDIIISGVCGPNELNAMANNWVNSANSWLEKRAIALTATVSLPDNPKAEPITAPLIAMSNEAGKIGVSGCVPVLAKGVPRGSRVYITLSFASTNQISLKDPSTLLSAIGSLGQAIGPFYPIGAVIGSFAEAAAKPSTQFVTGTNALLSVIQADSPFRPIVRELSPRQSTLKLSSQGLAINIKRIAEDPLFAPPPKDSTDSSAFDAIAYDFQRNTGKSIYDALGPARFVWGVPAPIYCGAIRTNLINAARSNTALYVRALYWLSRADSYTYIPLGRNCLLKREYVLLKNWKYTSLPYANADQFALDADATSVVAQISR